MSDAAPQRGLAPLVATLFILASALAGFWDVLWSGDGLTPPFAVLTVLLWIALGAPLALLALTKTSREEIRPSSKEAKSSTVMSGPRRLKR